MRNFVIAAVASVLLATPSLACSVVQGYRAPSNFELVQRADLVVLPRVESETSPTPVEWHTPNVRLHPIRAIKGELPAMPLGLRGTLSNRGEAATPHPTPLTEAHPSAFWGACIRQVYAKGRLVVATFVRQPDGSYRQITSPFSRAVEDVESEDGLWVRAATLYAAMQKLPGDPAAVIAAEAARLELLSDNAGALAIAADLRLQLRILAMGSPAGE